jgi:type IV secretory pathway VirB10-like protein
MATASKSNTSSNGKRKTTRQKHARAKPKPKQRSSRPNPKRWSHHVMETSDAMDIEHEIFKEGSAQEIADSLKKSSTRSNRRKGTPFQSAMSMLNFYINRAGRNLPKSRRTTLDNAKKRLREAFGRKP